MPIGLLPALLLAAGQAAAASPAPEFAALVVEFRSDAKFIGAPKHCPGATAEEDASEDMICTAELYEGPIRAIRRVSGPPSVHGRKLRYTAHAYAMREGARMLVMAYAMPDEDGLFAPWWRWPDARGDVCLDAAEAKTLKIEPQWRQWRARTIIGEGDHKRYPMRCIRL